MYRKILFFTISFVLIFPVFAWKSVPSERVYPNKNVIYNVSFTDYSNAFYQKLNDQSLNFDAFQYALKGYLKLKQKGRLTDSTYLTVVDMRKSANSERLFIINIKTQTLEHKSLVAHGRNSGLEYASKFSNIRNSHQTSLGFYKTAETYSGKHGYSLRLDGLEFSNNKARERAIVIHSADYAGVSFIKKNGRLGRSFGCPTLPKKNYKTIVSKIKEGSCLFIYYPKASYLKKSQLLNSKEVLFNPNT